MTLVGRTRHHVGSPQTRAGRHDATGHGNLQLSTLSRTVSGRKYKVKLSFWSVGHIPHPTNIIWEFIQNSDLVLTLDFKTLLSIRNQDLRAVWGRCWLRSNILSFDKPLDDAGTLQGWKSNVLEIIWVCELLRSSFKVLRNQNSVARSTQTS